MTMTRAAMLYALTTTAFIGGPGRLRPMTGIEANDVADLVFGPEPHRVDSPFGPLRCRYCGSTRMVLKSAPTAGPVHVWTCADCMGEQHEPTWRAGGDS